jgi:serine/threonine-protein kinase
VQGVPPALDELVADLLARDPARRPSSAREVRHRLAAICSQLGQQPLAPSGPPPSAPLSTTREQAVAADDRTAAEAIGARRGPWLGRPLLLAVLAVAALACAVVVARLW